MAYELQEEEINTNYLKHKRSDNKQEVNPKYRLCHTKDESIHHVIASFPMLSASMYLPVRHDQAAKEIYRKLITAGENAEVPIHESYSTDDMRHGTWWDTKIKTPCGVKYKTDIIVWRKNEKSAMSSILSFALDVNVAENCTLKNDHYFQLYAGLERIYTDY